MKIWTVAHHSGNSTYASSVKLFFDKESARLEYLEHLNEDLEYNCCPESYDEKEWYEEAKKNTVYDYDNGENWGTVEINEFEISLKELLKLTGGKYLKDELIHDLISEEI